VAEADTEVRKALARDARDDEALRLTGRILARRGDVDGAVEAIQRAIAVRPGNWLHHRTLGAVLYAAGRDKAAAETFRFMTRMQPDNPWGFQMLGAALQRQGDREGAIAAYQQSVALSPTAAAVSNLGVLHFERGDYAAAARAFRQATELAPRNPTYWRNLADARRRTGAGDAADAYRRSRQALDSLLAVDSSNPTYVSARLYASARAGECTEVAAKVDAARRSAERDRDALGDLVNAAVLCGAWRESRLVVEQLQQLGANPRDHIEGDVALAIKRRAGALPDRGADRP
jgi:Flp pilus assembly protein TadD